MCTYKVQNVSHVSACSKPKLQSVSASPSAFIRRAPEHSYFLYGGRLRRMAIKNIHSLRWWSARRRELMHPGKQGGANSLTLQASLSRCTKAGDIVSHLCNREPTIIGGQSEGPALRKDVHRHSLSGHLLCIVNAGRDSKVSIALESAPQVQGAPDDYKCAFVFVRWVTFCSLKTLNCNVTARKYLNCFIRTSGSCYLWTDIPLLLFCNFTMNLHF